MKILRELRDIELYHKINTDVKDDYDILYNELKDAAKNWVQYLERADNQHLQLYDSKNPVTEWIKIFFDL